MNIEPIYRRIGERLRVLREMRGESQEEVGKLVGLTRAAIANMENAKQRCMVHHLAVLAEHFGVKLQMFTSFDARGAK